MSRFRTGRLRALAAAAAMAALLALPAHGQAPAPPAPAAAGTPEAEALAILAAAGLREQILENGPQLAEQLRLHMTRLNQGRDADVRHAIETAILPAIARRLDELLAIAAQPLVRGFTLEELVIVRRFLELRLDQRLEGAMQLVAMEVDRESGDWVRRVAQDALAARSQDARLRGLRY
ncbi:MAG: hypothetical protein SNJ73_01595 [Acetobacteraceae bacterium]